MTALATVPAKDPRELALLKAVGLERVAPEQRELAIHIAERYGLDLMLKHLVLVDGRPYITRDGLLHIAHRSGVLDGIETTEPLIDSDGFWRASCSVYRKDMSRPFTYGGRYPSKGGNAKYAPEMAIKVAESMALRRAFDVAAPTQDERWDVPEAPHVPVTPPPSFAQRIADKVAAVTQEPTTPAGFLAASIDAALTPDAPVPVAEGQEALPIEDAEFVEAVVTANVPAGLGPLTTSGFRDIMANRQVAPEYVKAVRTEMFPDVESVANLTNEQRGALADEILSGGQ